MSNTNLPPYLTINLVPDYILKVFLQLPILSVIEETQRQTSQMQTLKHQSMQFVASTSNRWIK